jgi:2-dehydropantoate 2-reductase
MRYLVVGAGGIGGSLAAALSLGDADVVLAESDPEHLAAIREHGLIVEEPDRDPFAVLETVGPADLAGSFDAVLLAVKSRDTSAALTRIAPLLKPESVVVSLQNGLNEYEIAATVGTERTIGALVDFAAALVSPGRIKPLVAGEVVLGELAGPVTLRLERFAADLGAYFPVRLTDNVWGHLWGKVAFGSIMFMNVLSGLPQRDAIGTYPHLAVELASELLEVAAKLGVEPCFVDGMDPEIFLARATVPWADLRACLTHIQERVEPTPMTGMWRDIKLWGRSTEVDHMIGTAINLGTGVGCPCSLNRSLVAMVHEIEGGRRDMSPANLDELEALLRKAH